MLLLLLLLLLVLRLPLRLDHAVASLIHGHVVMSILFFFFFASSILIFSSIAIVVVLLLELILLVVEVLLLLRDQPQVRGMLVVVPGLREILLIVDAVGIIGLLLLVATLQLQLIQVMKISFTVSVIDRGHVQVGTGPISTLIKMLLLKVIVAATVIKLLLLQLGKSLNVVGLRSLINNNDGG